MFSTAPNSSCVVFRIFWIKNIDVAICQFLCYIFDWTRIHLLLLLPLPPPANHQNSRILFRTSLHSQLHYHGAIDIHWARGEEENVNENRTSQQYLVHSLCLYLLSKSRFMDRLRGQTWLMLDWMPRGACETKRNRAREREQNIEISGTHQCWLKSSGDIFNVLWIFLVMNWLSVNFHTIFF